jgi:hypothetical protein
MASQASQIWTFPSPLSASKQAADVLIVLLFYEIRAYIGKAYEVSINKDELIEIHNIFSLDHTIALDVLKSHPNRVEVADDVVTLGMLFDMSNVLPP